MVYQRGGSDGFNSIIDRRDFCGGVVCETVLIAGLFEDPFTIIEHVHERDPARFRGPALRYGAVAVVLFVVVYQDAVLIVDSLLSYGAVGDFATCCSGFEDMVNAGEDGDFTRDWGRGGHAKGDCCEH